MKFTQHILPMLALVMTVMLGAAADPAMAAGSSSFFVGTCHTGGLDPQAAMTAVNALPGGAHKTITFCPGTYQVNASLMVQTSNVLIKGMKGAVITTPVDYNGSAINISGVNNVTLEGLTFKPGNNYDGNLVFFANVKGAVAQKLVIDAQGTLRDDGDLTALTFFQTSGKMTGNQVRNWHAADFEGLAVAAQFEGSGTEKVSFTGNTISNFEHLAVNAFSLASLTATGNKISGTAANAFGPAVQEGIVAQDVHKGTISGNTVTGGSVPLSGNAAGLLIISSGKLLVSGNKLSHWDTGIELDGGCLPNSATIRNKITGNQLRETNVGILLNAPGSPTCDVSVDSNTVTGNKLVNTASQGHLGFGITVTDAGTGFISSAFDEVVTGNTISGFATGMSSPLPDPGAHITGKFAPNKVK